jgi:O-antigen ligase
MTAPTGARSLSVPFWGAWVALALLTILNANSVAVLAGAPERLFNPIILLFALLVFGSRLHEVRVLVRPPMVSVLVFAVVFLLVGVFAATNSTHAHLEDALFKVPLYGASMLIMLAAALTAARADQAGQVTLLLKTLFWPLLLASLSGVAFVTIPAIGALLSLLPGERLHGVFGNTNELGGQAGYALVLGLVLTMRTRSPTWAVMGTLAGAIGVISSFSKSAMLGFLPLLVLIVYALSGAQLRVRPLLLLAVASVITAFGVYELADQLVSGNLGVALSTDQRVRLESIMEIISSGALDESTTTGRSAIWGVGLQHWSTSPITGLGLSAFDRVRGVDMEIHNTALRVLGESGLLGMIAFMGMVVSLLLAVFRHPRRDVHVLAVGFLLVQFPAIVSTGGIMLARNHNLLSGCVLGLLIGRMAVRSPQPPITSPA